MESKVVVLFVCFLLTCGVLILETQVPRSGIGWRKRYDGGGVWRRMEEEEEDGGITLQVRVKFQDSIHTK